MPSKICEHLQQGCLVLQVAPSNVYCRFVTSVCLLHSSARSVLNICSNSITTIMAVADTASLILLVSSLDVLEGQASIRLTARTSKKTSRAIRMNRFSAFCLVQPWLLLCRSLLHCLGVVSHPAFQAHHQVFLKAEWWVLKVPRDNHCCFAVLNHYLGREQHIDDALAFRRRFVPWYCESTRNISSTQTLSGLVANRQSILDIWLDLELLNMCFRQRLMCSQMYCVLIMLSFSIVLDPNINCGVREDMHPKVKETNKYVLHKVFAVQGFDLSNKRF